MSDRVYSFSTDQQPRLAEVGGKAQSLIRGKQAGLPVPDGLVLSVSFFSEWDAKIQATPEWSALLLEPDKHSCDAVKHLAKSLRFSASMHREFSREFSRLLGSPAADLAFAVRSSSPEEDLAGISFAGMYETFLGTQAGQIEETIARAYCSMFDFRVVEYKTRHGINMENAAIAVIVQHQIASDVSGIGFSLNPLNNCYDEAVINASFGLGEAIVSGRVTPDEFIVEKNEMRVLESNIRQKHFALALNPGGGVSDLPITDPAKASLSKGQVLEITKLIKKVEAFYTLPVDTEWAYSKGCLYLLQARPITTYFPLFEELITAPGTPKKLYMDMLVVTQGFSKRLSILGGDIWAIVLERLKRGTVPAGAGGYILNLHGRQYFQLHNMIKGIGKRAFGLATSYDNALEGREDEILRDYKAPKMSPLMKKARWAQIKMAVQLVPVMIRLLWDPVSVAKGTEASIESLLTEFNSMKNDRPFDALVEKGFKAFDNAFFGFAVYMAGFLAEKRIERMMRGTKGAALKMFLLMDVPSNPTSSMGHALLALARFPEIQQTINAKDFEEKIRTRGYSAEFMAKFDAYIRRYGARGLREIDIATPRVMERLGDFFLQIRAINIDDNQMITAGTRKAEAISKMREIAKTKGKLGAFNKHLRTIEVCYGHRETPKYLVVVLTGALRRIALELGQDFVAQGRLDVVEDIFELSIAQIARAQKDDTLLLPPLIEASLRPLKIMENVKEYPNYFDSRGKIFRKKIDAGSDDLAGMAVSNGIYTGRAKVLKTPYEKRVEPGDILVTIATEPSWTPIFINASAVVLEVGGGLQHGAIIAREYGLPCVSGLPGVTSIINDGDLLKVDGTNGIVKILKKAKQPPDLRR